MQLSKPCVHDIVHCSSVAKGEERKLSTPKRYRGVEEEWKLTMDDLEAIIIIQMLGATMIAIKWGKIHTQMFILYIIFCKLHTV
jgi:hypothetical protein